MVALTRTRKQCHIITNQWLVSPRDPKTGAYISPYEDSIFISWINPKLIKNKGSYNASKFKK